VNAFRHRKTRQELSAIRARPRIEQQNAVLASLMAFLKATIDVLEQGLPLN